MRHRIRHFQLLVLASALALGAMPSASIAARPDHVQALQRLSGTYRYVGGEEEIRAVEQAIDEAVADMNFLIRGIAVKRLREPNLPSEELRIVVGDDDVRVVRSEQPTIAAPPDGEAVTWRNPENGNTLRVRHRVVEGGALEQRLRGDRGLSVNRFVLRDDGATLVVDTVITADKLSVPLRFSTTYEREGR